MESEKTDIFDFSGEKFSKFTMPCWIIFVIVPSMAIFNIYFFLVNFGPANWAIISILECSTTDFT